MATRSLELRERIASTLNVSSRCVRVDRWQYNRRRSALHGWGSSSGKRFFAKILALDPFPLTTPLSVPKEKAIPRTQVRSAKDQIETEWHVTNELRALMGPSCVPAPLGKSGTARTIVWEEVRGMRLDHLVSRSRWRDPQGNASAAALFQAGAWLRKVHDGFSRGSETLDIARLIEIIPDSVGRGGWRSSRYANVASKLLETAVAKAGGASRLRVPVALTHGDFSLPNLMWSEKENQLFVFDFEHAADRGILHDLVVLISNLRFKLLNPLIPPRVLESAEKAFWAGYGSVSREMSVFVDALACAWIFYCALPWLSELRKRRGWKAGIKTWIYEAFFEDFLIARRMGVPSSH